MEILVTYNPGSKDTDAAHLAASVLAERFGTAIPVEADATLFERVSGAGPDLVFNMASGASGEAPEAQVPAMLEMLGVPYTGSGPMAMALCAHRARAKEVLSSYGIPTPGFVVTDGGEIDVDNLFPFPLVVKPAYSVALEGGTPGPTGRVVMTTDELTEAASQVSSSHACAKVPVLIEEFIPGREFSVLLVGDGKAMRCVSFVENQSVFPAFAAAGGGTEDAGEALGIAGGAGSLGKMLTGAATRVAIDTAASVGARDYCEVVIRLSTELVPTVVAIRPRPELGAIARAEDGAAEDLVIKITESAIARCGL